jgi:predicted nucleic-acid-binding Zn-ribbon protein
MCRQATCKNCGKTTWAGCGQHVDQVMKGVPKDQRCKCTAAEKAAAKKQGGFFSKLFG